MTPEIYDLRRYLVGCRRRLRRALDESTSESEAHSRLRAYQSVEQTLPHTPPRWIDRRGRVLS